MAQFRTAYLQKANALKCFVSGIYLGGVISGATRPGWVNAHEARVADPASVDYLFAGDMVAIVPPSGNIQLPMIYRVLSLADATHIIAQGDMTLAVGAYQNGPFVFNRDYRYSGWVDATFGMTAGGPGSTPPAGTTTWPAHKRVNLYSIWDKADIIIEPGKGETA